MTAAEADFEFEYEFERRRGTEWENKGDEPEEKRREPGRGCSGQKQHEEPGCVLCLAGWL